jgi:hypothetical protein
LFRHCKAKRSSLPASSHFIPPHFHHFLISHPFLHLPLILQNRHPNPIKQGQQKARQALALHDLIIEGPQSLQVAVLPLALAALPSEFLCREQRLGKRVCGRVVGDQAAAKRVVCDEEAVRLQEARACGGWLGEGEDEIEVFGIRDLVGVDED